MIPLLVIAVWILVLALVAGLCMAARVGDVGGGQLTDAPAPVGWESAQAPPWGQADDLVISARARTGGSLAEPQPDAALVHSRGVAA